METNGLMTFGQRFLLDKQIAGKMNLLEAKLMNNLNIEFDYVDFLKKLRAENLATVVKEKYEKKETIKRIVEHQ
jgi:hypothetical protein